MQRRRETNVCREVDARFGAFNRRDAIRSDSSLDTPFHPSTRQLIIIKIVKKLEYLSPGLRANKTISAENQETDVNSSPRNLA